MNLIKRVSMFARPSIDGENSQSHDGDEISKEDTPSLIPEDILPLDPGPAFNFDKAYADLEHDASGQPRDQLMRESAKRVYHQFTRTTDPDEHRRIWDTDPIFDAEMLEVRREDYLRYRAWAELQLKAANDALQEHKFRLWDEQAETRKWRDLVQNLMRTHLPADKQKDMTYKEMQKYVRELRESQTINEPVAGLSPLRGERFDANAPLAIPAERMPPLWDNHQDRSTQRQVELCLTSASLMQRMKNFRKMQLRAEKAEAAARKLGYDPLVARCMYYKGIALVGMEQGTEASQIFAEVEPCRGRYEEGKWLKAWTAHSTALSPLHSEFSEEDGPMRAPRRA